MVIDALRDHLEATEELLARVDPGQFTSTTAVETVGLLIRHERRTVAVRTSLVSAAAQGEAWRRSGARTVEDWLGRELGVSRSAAKRTARTAERLTGLDRLRDAFTGGEVSEAQTEVIADAAEADPTSQDRLVDCARHRAFNELRDECGRTKAAADDEDDTKRRRRLRAGRRAGSFTDSEGFWGMWGRFEPDRGAEIGAIWDAETSRRFARARAEGRWESMDAYRADALWSLITGNPTTPTGEDASTDDADAAAGADGQRAPVRQPAKELILVCDLAAYRRGEVLLEETCEIVGVGPVPVAVAREWEDDAFVKAVIRDGTDIRTVAHFGRAIPAELKTALWLRDPYCSVPRCGNTIALEVDHDQIDFADGGALSIDNANRKCDGCHHQKTHDRHRLEGQPGAARWVDADGNTLTQDPLFPHDEQAQAP